MVRFIRAALTLVALAVVANTGVAAADENPGMMGYIRRFLGEAAPTTGGEPPTGGAGNKGDAAPAPAPDMHTTGEEPPTGGAGNGGDAAPAPAPDMHMHTTGGEAAPAPSMNDPEAAAPAPSDDKPIGGATPAPMKEGEAPQVANCGGPPECAKYDQIACEAEKPLGCFWTVPAKDTDVAGGEAAAPSPSMNDPEAAAPAPSDDKPIGGATPAPMKEGEDAAPTPAPPGLDVAAEAKAGFAKFANTMTLTAQVKINGVAQASGTLKAYVGTELRGWEDVPQNPPFGTYVGQPMYAIMLYADRSDETLRFEYDTGSGTVIELKETLDFVMNGNEGKVTEPKFLTAGNTAASTTSMPATTATPLTTTVPATLAPTTSVAPLTTTVPATLAPTTSAAPITTAPSTAAPATTSAPNLVAATVKATVIFTGITKADVDSDLARKALTDGMADSLGVPKDTVYIESMTEVSSRRMLKLKRRRLAAVTLEIVFAIRVDTKEAASLAVQLNSAEQATKSAR